MPRYFFIGWTACFWILFIIYQYLSPQGEIKLRQRRGVGHYLWQEWWADFYLGSFQFIIVYQEEKNKQNLNWWNAKERRVLAGSQRSCSSLLCHSWPAEGPCEHINRGRRDLCRHLTASHVFLHCTVLLPHFMSTADWNHGEALRSAGEESMACENQGA